MIERRLKPRVDYCSVESRKYLVLRFNSCLGEPSRADLSIQDAFLNGTMRPGEFQFFVSICEYVIVSDHAAA